MTKKVFLLTAFLAYILSFNSFPQQQAVSPIPVDTLHNLEAIHLIKNILANNFSDPLYKQVCVFSNPDCHRCTDLHNELLAKNIKFNDYDLRDSKLLDKVQAMVVKKEKSEKVAFNFPMLLYKGEIYYNIGDFKVFVEELSKKISP